MTIETKLYQNMLNQKRMYTLNSLSCYWRGKIDILLKLPIPVVEAIDIEHLPPQTQLITLPDWAKDVGINGQILIPNQFIASGEGIIWSRVDWVSVIFWYLNGVAERAFEAHQGPVHSYSYRLTGWDKRLWERAWVNRIALFLRRWAARFHQLNEEDLFGPLPKPQIILTHDVDAITKTMLIRLKQSAFHFFNVIRYLRRGHFGHAASKLKQGVGFFFLKATIGALNALKQWRLLVAGEAIFLFTAVAAGGGDILNQY